MGAVAPKTKNFRNKHILTFLVNDQLDALFSMYLFHASTCFEQQVLIIRRIKVCQSFLKHTFVILDNPLISRMYYTR
jgi:hypothetical protein